ncbi:MAG: 3-hydroxyacyl-CoA dehydrogenase family protein, partial [Dehalococcoidia bacterium]
APQNAILASNTSNMSITKIGGATQRPDKVVGLHFFNPVVMMLLVEVIRGEKTSDETMDITYDLMKKWKNFRGAMVPVRVEKDTAGFIYNRVGSPAGIYLMEMLQRKLVTPEGVDAKVKSFGSPMGPYETMDYTGLDINSNGMNYLSTVLSPDYKPRQWLLDLVKAGTLGKKTGKGIYEWPNGERPKIDPAKADPNFDPMDIICLQVNEGTKLIEQGVARSAAEVDLAITNGGGGAFGPFALAKGLGWDKVAAKCEKISRDLGVQWFMPTEMLKKGNIQI